MVMNVSVTPAPRVATLDCGLSPYISMSRKELKMNGYCVANSPYSTTLSPATMRRTTMMPSSPCLWLTTTALHSWIFADAPRICVAAQHFVPNMKLSINVYYHGRCCQITCLTCHTVTSRTSIMSHGPLLFPTFPHTFCPFDRDSYHLTQHCFKSAGPRQDIMHQARD